MGDFAARLPAPLTTRPLTMGDAAAVTALIARCELEDLGEAAIEEADVVADWRRPSFDLATESVGIFDGGELVAAAEVYRGRRAQVVVAPEARGAGLGRLLAEWTGEVARRRGGRLVGQPVPDANIEAAALLSSLGYEPLWTSWVMELPSGAAIGEEGVPDGFAIRAADPDGDARAAWQVIEDAFNEWPHRDPTTFEDWAPTVTGREGFEPWMLQVAVTRGEGGEEVVGACVVLVAAGSAYVSQIAVRADCRGRGLARALLARAFTLGRAHGATHFELSTDSRTGALGLYQRVGMRVKQTWTHWARPLP